MTLSIIIVNYNVKYFLEQCLASVKQAIKGIDAEVIVIDNCSTDNSVNFLRENFHWIKLIENKKNEGFAKANNTALKYCTGKYILYLNPDTILPENILKDCMLFFETNKEAGAAGVRMLDGTGSFLPESKRSFPSPFVSFFKLTGLSSLFPESKIFNRYALGYLDERREYEVDVLCGAFLMGRKPLLDQLGGFDEAFFMYGEDIDLCYRILKSGKKNYYLGTQTIIHFKGESSGKDNRKYLQHFYGAMSIFVKKHYAKDDAFFIKILLKTGIFLKSVLSLATLPFLHKPKAGAQVNNLFLTGAKDACVETEAILKSQRSNVNFKKCFDFDSPYTEAIKNDSVVFCIGELTYKKSIKFVDEKKKKHFYLWHGLHTKSITGSAYKKVTGLTYSLED